MTPVRRGFLAQTARLDLPVRRGLKALLARQVPQVQALPVRLGRSDLKVRLVQLDPLAPVKQDRPVRRVILVQPAPQDQREQELRVLPDRLDRKVCMVSKARPVQPDLLVPARRDQLAQRV